MLLKDNKKIIIANLKMNILSLRERDLFWSSLTKESKLTKKQIKNKTEVIICPPSIYLESFVKRFKKNQWINIGAQNIHWEKKGAFTGEISVPMLKGLDIKWSIIGHSERRKYFCETDEIVNQKILIALKNDILPIFCTGETAKEKEKGKRKEVLTNQIIKGLNQVSKARVEKIIFAYEPVWAIGTGETPSADDILEARLLIKKIIAKKYSLKIAEKIKIIYGGSVVSKNANQVILKSQMDGALVGGASLYPKEFFKIIAKIV